MEIMSAIGKVATILVKDGAGLIVLILIVGLIELGRSKS